ncbi:CPW-WPC family protein [Plasmodium sp. gorilla clade G1]|nr:CPW-WPC family protein [Plasmodium sp. gorilla clade G1]
MKFSFFSVVICFVILAYSASLNREKEKKKKKSDIHIESNKIDKNIKKFDYGTLKKKFHINDKDENVKDVNKYNEIGENGKNGKNGKNEKNGKIGKNGKNEENEKNKQPEGISVSLEKTNSLEETLVQINNEYNKCIDMIEKEIHDNIDDKESLKVKDELEKLCVIKKEKDEKEEYEKYKKKMKEKSMEMDMDNEKEERKRINDDIKSQLGISSKIEVTNEVLNDSLSEIKNCVRNYREKCPLNWKINKDNKLYCMAPESYKGPCERKLITNLDISEKIKIEKKCYIFWQCENNCVQDFENSICPLEWTMKNEEYCISPESYIGNCLNQINFINMTNKEKAIYSNLCDVRWPCKKKCEHDYSVLCPDEWIEGNDGYCFPTRNYKGNCKNKIYFKHLDKIMKETYEQKCQFSYPCINSCEKNYDDLCPNLWISINGNECAPSEYYNGSCKENYIFKKKNVEEKKMFENLCEVSYPCLKKCKRNYSYSCPIGWKETLSFCLAPNSYKFNCNKLIKNDMNEKEKIEISKKCHIFWPCENYEILLKKLIYNNMTEKDYLSIVNGPVDNTTGKVIYI